MDTSVTFNARINKLDGENFHLWKCKMQMVLEERDLRDVLSGEVRLEYLTNHWIKCLASASHVRPWR